MSVSNLYLRVYCFCNDHTTPINWITKPMRWMSMNKLHLSYCRAAWTHQVYLGLIVVIWAGLKVDCATISFLFSMGSLSLFWQLSHWINYESWNWSCSRAWLWPSCHSWIGHVKIITTIEFFGGSPFLTGISRIDQWKLYTLSLT